ncbi:MAG: hypothetical protein ACMXYM_02735 [Candidatus Woesearchaeota archaeon]
MATPEKRPWLTVLLYVSIAVMIISFYLLSIWFLLVVLFMAFVTYYVKVAHKKGRELYVAQNGFVELARDEHYLDLFRGFSFVEGYANAKTPEYLYEKRMDGATLVLFGYLQTYSPGGAVTSAINGRGPYVSRSASVSNRVFALVDPTLDLPHLRITKNKIMYRLGRLSHKISLSDRRDIARKILVSSGSPLSRKDISDEVLDAVVRSGPLYPIEMKGSVILTYWKDVPPRYFSDLIDLLMRIRSAVRSH